MGLLGKLGIGQKQVKVSEFATLEEFIKYIEALSSKQDLGRLGAKLIGKKPQIKHWYATVVPYRDRFSLGVQLDYLLEAATEGGKELMRWHASKEFGFVPRNWASSDELGRYANQEQPIPLKDFPQSKWREIFFAHSIQLFTGQMVSCFNYLERSACIKLPEIGQKEIGDMWKLRNVIEKYEKDKAYIPIRGK